jgi:hypothetical protein
MSNRTLKTGDSFPPHVRVLEDEDGPLDLPVGATVRIIARNGAVVISDTCTVMTIQQALDTGYLRGAWATADLTKRAAVMWDIDPPDTALAGAYSYEYEVTHAPGDIETIPNTRALNPVLTIEEDLD